MPATATSPARALASDRLADPLAPVAIEVGVSLPAAQLDGRGGAGVGGWVRDGSGAGGGRLHARLPGGAVG